MARENADIERVTPALVKVDGRVIVIGGSNSNIPGTVSSHELMINTWVPNLPQLNEAREDAGGCFLAGQVYVFAGYNG